MENAFSYQGIAHNITEAIRQKELGASTPDSYRFTSNTPVVGFGRVVAITHGLPADQEYFRCIRGEGAPLQNFSQR